LEGGKKGSRGGGTNAIATKKKGKIRSVELSQIYKRSSCNIEREGG